MSDLEITKLCAEAMGNIQFRDGGFYRLHDGAGMTEPAWFEFIYAPLTHDEQAMALLKKFPIAIGVVRGGGWIVACDATGGWRQYANLNRGIVECVAKLQLTKEPK